MARLSKDAKSALHDLESAVKISTADIAATSTKKAKLVYQKIPEILHKSIFGPISMFGFSHYFYTIWLFALDSDRLCAPDRITEKSISTIF